MSIKPGAWAFNYIFLEKINSDNWKKSSFTALKHKSELILNNWRQIQVIFSVALSVKLKSEPSLK